MALSKLLLSLTCLAASVSATGVLLPLYVYPSAVSNDGAANWRPAFEAISAHPAVPWQVVVNPGSGPGSATPGNGDTNYISGVSQLNAFANVVVTGYVHTLYGTADIADVHNNITSWANWASYTAADISVQGIFFDECADTFDYLSEAISFARLAFPTPITTICNFGAAAPASYYAAGICDIVIAFESCLNCPAGPPYRSQATLDANIPNGNEAKAAILVHTFTGTAVDGSAANGALLDSYVDTIKANGVGWAYFGSASYDSITTAPATIGALADAVA